MGRETAPLSSHPPPLPHQAMPASHVRQQQQASYRQRYKSHFGDRAGQGFGFGVRNLVSLPNMMLVWPFSVLPTASQGGYSQCKSTPTCLARVRRQQGQDPLPPPSPKPCPPHHLPLIVSRAHLHMKGILQRGGGACSSIPVVVPILATAAASAPPSPGFLSCLWVWSKLDALKKLFMCVRVCVRVCVNHMIVIHLYPEQRPCTV